MITTTKGMMDEALLNKREGEINNNHELTRWVEYWHEGELVHRSVHVHLKEAPALFPELEKLNG